MTEANERCRHGAKLCYRCGVGVKRKPAIEPQPAKITRQPKRKRHCIHRGERVGVAKCQCQVKTEVYRCTRLIRPNTEALEQALCSQAVFTKPTVDIVSDAGETVLATVQTREIVTCSPRFCDCFSLS